MLASEWVTVRQPVDNNIVLLSPTPCTYDNINSFSLFVQAWRLWSGDDYLISVHIRCVMVIMKCLGECLGVKFKETIYSASLWVLVKWFQSGRECYWCASCYCMARLDCWLRYKTRQDNLSTEGCHIYLVYMWRPLVIFSWNCRVSQMSCGSCKFHTTLLHLQKA